MIDFGVLIPTNSNNNIFTSLTTEYESLLESPQKIELLDKFITKYPRLTEDDIQTPEFAFTYFEADRTDFMKNQDYIQIISNELLGHTQPLTEFEQRVLNTSYRKSLKTAPTRPNRL